MGRPKHLLALEGLTWVERAALVLQQAVARVVIAGAGEVPASLAHIARIDDAPGISGPLAGILAALRSNPRVSWLVAACDLPALRLEALQWLLAQREAGILAVLPDLEGRGLVEPLLAYYDRRCLPLLESLAASGRFQPSLLKTAAGVRTPQPPLCLRDAWRNVNSPEDMHMLAAYPSGRGITGT